MKTAGAENWKLVTLKMSGKLSLGLQHRLPLNWCLSWLELGLKHCFFL